MFIGEYRHTLDSKSRLSVPVKLREQLGAEFVMCRGFEKCIMIYPKDAWEEFARKFESLQIVKDRRVPRYFFSSGEWANMDGQGRVIIPQRFRTFAGIQTNVVLIGNNTHLELWDEEAWDAELEGGMKSETIMSCMMDLGF